MKSIPLFAAMAVLPVSMLHTEESTASETDAAPEGGDGWELLEVERIWDEAPHNAFTDLAYFRDHWYCAFREAGGHHTRDGRLRVIRSRDGREWETVALMQGENDGDDVRDARFSITADGHLMLNGAITLGGDDPRNRLSVTWLSPDGVHWSRAYACPSGEDTWRWSTTWHDDHAFSVAYTGKDRNGHLYRSKDGITWESVRENFFPEEFGGRKNEAYLHFDADGTAYCLLRRDGEGKDWSADALESSALLGTAGPPYTDWTWEDLGVRVGGPILRRLEDGRFVSVVRLYSPPRTALLEIDVEQPSAVKRLDLPSKGDSSYAGIVERDGELWVSYYSSHEDKTAIYLAKIRIPEAEGGEKQ